MKTRFTFAAFDPRGRTMAVAEGETIPLGWFISVGGAAPAEVTEVTTVVGTSADISNPYDGGPEVWVRTLSVQTASQVAAIATAAAADIVGHAEAARLTAIITDAGITGLSVVWASFYRGDKIGLRMGVGSGLVTEAYVRGHIPYWLDCQAAAAVKAAAAAAAAAEAAIWAGMPDVISLTQAEFLRCGWKSAEQGRLTMTGGPDPDHHPVDGVMFLYRKDYASEGYYFRGGFVRTGYTRTDTVVATHPRYAAAIAAARAAWAGKTAITSDSLLSVIRTSMGDIITPIAPPPPTQAENLAAEAAALAAQKAANAARRQARYDREAAELAAIQAARLAKRYTGTLRLPHSQPESPAPEAAPAPAPISSSSVNLNDPWGSLSALKL
jgi:hypothetical protein